MSIFAKCVGAATILVLPPFGSRASLGPLEHRPPTSHEVQLLHGKTLVNGGDYKVSLELVVIGNKLILVNLPPAAPVQIRRAEDGKLLKEIGEWGSGDGQFTGAYHLDPAEDQSARCWVYDLTRHRLALVDVSDAALREPSSIRKWLTLRADAALTAPTWAGDTVFSPGFFYMGRLAVFGPDGKFQRFIGSAPRRDSEPPVVTQQAFQAVMRASPSRDRFALATRNAGELEIYSRDGQHIAASTPTRFDPKYSVMYHAGEAKFVRDHESRYGYLDLATDSATIYALFSNRRDSEVGFYPDGKFIHVFDWKGHLLSVYELPDLASAIALDAPHHRLFVIHTAPEPHLAVYDLPR